MIKEVIMYTVICDGCGTDCNEDAEHSCWNDESYAVDDAMEQDWIEEGDKHYCPWCYTYDENDNLEIKNRQNK